MSRCIQIHRYDSVRDGMLFAGIVTVLKDCLSDVPIRHQIAKSGWSREARIGNRNQEASPGGNCIDSLLIYRPAQEQNLAEKVPLSIQLTKLVTVFEVCNTEESAVASFSKLTDEAAAEKPSVTLPGTVERIIQSPHPSIPEKAEISVQGADELYQEIRIKNTLTDEHGDEVRMKKGAHVEVTVEAELGATTSTSANSKN